MKFTRVTVNPNQMGGVPCIRGLRIPVATVVGSVADGMSDAEILGSSRNTTQCSEMCVVELRDGE
jgi:uncharacterized protein (DUF433 family)